MADEANLVPDTYPMGDGGPSQTEIDEMKKKHGPLKGCYVAENRYIIRMMTRAEYLDFQKEVNDRMVAGDVDFDVDSEITSKYTVWPTELEWGQEPGGVATVIAQEVSKFSGFVAERESQAL
jgi:hypothetical protein